MKQYRLGLYEKAMPKTLTWLEKFSVAKAAGYDFLEISIDADEEKLARIHMSDAEKQEILDAAKATGIRSSSLCVSGLTKWALGSMDEKVRSRGLEIAFGAVDLAADLNVRVMMIPGYDVYYETGTEQTEAYFIENVRKLAEYAAARGVFIGFETMENAFMNSVEKAMKYVRIIDSPFIQIYPDTGNITNAAVLYEKDVLKDLETGRGHILALHLKESKPGIFREIPYGTGHVDFEALAGKARELGVRRFMTEFWYLGSADWKQECIDTGRHFTALLDRVFEDPCFRDSKESLA